MTTEKDTRICEDYTLVTDKNILYWMDNTHIFYYSCENCTKCNKCNKFDKM